MATAAGLDFLKANDPEAATRIVALEAAVIAAQATADAAQVDVGEASAAPVDAVAATDTLTSNNTNVSDTNTVTVNGTVYTFKTALTPVEGEVLIGADADASLLNLIRAINHTGTPDTDYSVAAAHTTVSSSASVSSHAITLTAKTKGALGNAYTLAKSAVTLSVGGALFTGGIDGTVGAAGLIVTYSGQPYICLSAATTAASGAWKKLTVAAL